MKQILLLATLLAIVVIACNNNHTEALRSVHKSDLIAEQTDSSLKIAPEELMTKTAKRILLYETHPAGQSISRVEIIPIDFKNKLPVLIGNSDPVEKAELADLDQNGFDEIYIFTRSAGSGSYGNIYAYSSYKDEKLVKIKIPAITDKDLAKDGIFAGYMGHDEFKISENKILRTFPLFRDNDTDVSPGGGNRTIYYTLKNNVLVIEK